MARLPEPGKDAGEWGNILNDYLSQTLDADGGLLPDTVSSIQIVDGSLSESLLDSNVTTKLNNTVVSDGAITSTKIADSAVTTTKINTSAAPSAGQVLSYNGTALAWTTPITGGTPADSSSTSKGVVQLAGDLSGTATAPTVPALANKADKATTYTKTEVDNALTAKADQSTTYTKTEVDNALTAKADTTDLTNYIPSSQKAAANGIATLDATGKIPAGQLPSTGGTVASNYFVFSKPGVLDVGVGTTRLTVPKAGTIVSAVASVGTRSSGSAIIVDINRNGTSIFSNQANRPTIPADTYQAPIVTTSVAVPSNSYLSVDIDQVGSTLTGADLTVTIEYVS